MLHVMRLFACFTKPVRLPAHADVHDGIPVCSRSCDVRWHCRVCIGVWRPRQQHRRISSRLTRTVWLVGLVAVGHIPCGAACEAAAAQPGCG